MYPFIPLQPFTILFTRVTERRKCTTHKSHSKEILRTMATSVPYYVSSQLNVLIRVWLTSILCCENTADLWLFTICKDVNLTASTTKCLRQQHKALPLQRWCNHPFPHFQAVISPGVWRTPSPTPLVKKQIKIHQKKKGIKESADTPKSFKRRPTLSKDEYY